VLYEMLSEIVGDFTTQQRLDEVGHGMDTQANEALNNTIAWKAPKGKTYLGSTSLENRVCIAVSTHLIGPEECWQRLFMSLGMTLRLGTAHYLRLQTRALESRRTKQKKIDVKRKRNDKNFIKLKEQLQKLLLDTKEGRQYKPGVALEKEGAGKSNTTSTSTKPDRRGCRCGNVNHQRTSSFKCPW